MRYIHFIITFPNKCEADQEKDLFEYVHMYCHMLLYFYNCTWFIQKKLLEKVFGEV